MDVCVAQVKKRAEVLLFNVDPDVSGSLNCLIAGLPNSMESYVEDSEMFPVGFLDYAKDGVIDPARGCCADPG